MMKYADKEKKQRIDNKGKNCTDAQFARLRAINAALRASPGFKNPGFAASSKSYENHRFSTFRDK